MAADHSLVFLRFLAIILITNSHLDALYPNPQFGTGGALGNSIFFFISAIGITLSGKPNLQNIVEWYKRRASRILPTLWLAILLLVVLGKYEGLELSQFFLLFVFPKDFWFLPALLVMYVPLYFMVRYYSFSLFLKFAMSFSLIYFVWYLNTFDSARFSIEDFGFFKSFFYFIIMGFGVYVGKNSDFFFMARKYDFLKLLLVTIFYFGFKLFLLKTGYYEWQFISQLLTIPWLIFLARLFSHDCFGSFLSSSRYGKLVITVVAALTLEIYLMQSLIYSSPLITNNVFPLNLFIFVVLVVLSAYFLQKSINVIKYVAARVFSAQ